MSSVLKHKPASETFIRDKGQYVTKFLYWKGYVDRHPLLTSALAANADAVCASWRTTGTEQATMAQILDLWGKEDKESFRLKMKNLLQMAQIGGDAYAEIILDDPDIEGIDGEVPVDVRILPPDNIQQEIINGRIKKFVELSPSMRGEKAEEWKPEEMFHLPYGKIGASTHGQSQIQPLQNILLHKEQLLLNGSKLYELYIQPIMLVITKSDSPKEQQDIKDDWNAVNKTDQKVLFVAEDNISKVEPVGPKGTQLDPSGWIAVLDGEIIKKFRTSEVMLGTGAVNSEESARYQFTGFRQMVRADQSFLEDNLERQIFPQVYPEDTPGIKFSFATEAQEEKWKRDLETITAIKANVVDPALSNLLIIKTLIEMGVIPNV